MAYDVFAKARRYLRSSDERLVHCYLSWYMLRGTALSNKPAPTESLMNMGKHLGMTMYFDPRSQAILLRPLR